MYHRLDDIADDRWSQSSRRFQNSGSDLKTKCTGPPSDSGSFIVPSAGRDKVHGKPLVTLQPVLNFGVLVRGIVVDDQMQIQFWRRLRINLLRFNAVFAFQCCNRTLSADERRRGDDVPFRGRRKAGSDHRRRNPNVPIAAPESSPTRRYFGASIDLIVSASARL